MTFHSSRGRGRRLPASGSFDIGYLALCRYASTRHLPPSPSGGSPMGADRPMFHASPPGGSLPICECVCDLPLPLLPFYTGLPPRPCGQICVACRCRTLPRASSRRTDWSHCYAYLASVSSVSTCRAISGPPGQSCGGHHTFFLSPSSSMVHRRFLSFGNAHP